MPTNLLKVSITTEKSQYKTQNLQAKKRRALYILSKNEEDTESITTRKGQNCREKSRNFPSSICQSHFDGMSETRVVVMSSTSLPSLPFMIN